MASNRFLAASPEQSSATLSGWHSAGGPALARTAEPTPRRSDCAGSFPSAPGGLSGLTVSQGDTQRSLTMSDEPRPGLGSWDKSPLHRRDFLRQAGEASAVLASGATLDASCQQTEQPPPPKLRDYLTNPPDF